jgi:glycine betaine/proline transport system substrate-binding protein
MPHHASRQLRTALRLGAGLLALGMTLSACAGDSDSGGGGGDGESPAERTMSFGIIPSWTDGLSVGYLLKNILEEEGYAVEIIELSEAAPLYAGLSEGDIDVYPSAWPEVTHAAYMKQYGDQLEDLAAWYDNAKLTFAVPEYTDIDSIAELPDNVDKFGGEVIGIEPGAGLTKVTKESVFPTYGLEDAGYKLVLSSTTAMLTALQSAVDNEEDIVVTLWRPYWANNEFPVKDLEDPEGALGEAEALHVLAHKGFSDEFPEVAEMLSDFKLDDEQYGTLEDMVVNEYGQGKEEQAVAAWLEENPDVKDALSTS